MLSGRNLIYEGREQSREIGLHQRALGIPIGDALSSTACRCWETALLMTGHYDAQSRWAGAGGGGAGQDARWKDMDSVPTNGNRIIVTHDAVCQAMYNPGGDGEIVTTAEYMEGDALIVRPLGDTNEVLAQWNSETWQRYHIRFPDGTVGVNDTHTASADGHVRIAPNPSSAHVRVTVSTPDRYVIVDELGRVVMTRYIDVEDVIDVTSFGNGTYALRGTSSGSAARFIIAR